MKKLMLVYVLGILSSFAFSQSSNFTEGKKAFDNGDFDISLDYFNKEISDNPKSTLTYYYRGYLHYAKSEYAKALNDINSGLKTVGKKQKVLKAAFYDLRAKVNIQIEEPEKALADFSTSLKFDAADPEVYISRAQLYFDKKLYDKAENDFLSVLKIDETNADAYAGLARNYIDQDMFTEADKILLKLKKLHPEYDNAYYYNAISFYNQGKFNEAIDDSFTAFSIDTDDSSNRELFISYAAKNYPFAISKIAHKLNTDPQDYFWLFYKGLLQHNNEDYNNAIVSFTKTMALMDEPIIAILSRRAKCYAEIGFHALAIADYDLIFSIDSTRAYDFAYRADAKRLMGNYEEAIKDFTIAIELEPREEWFYLRRGWVYEAFLKNNVAGLKDYNTAIELNKNYAYSYLMRGRMYKQKLDQPDKATSDFETILKLDTAVSIQGNCRQYALLELDRDKESIEWLAKILQQYPTHGNYFDAACLYSLMKKPVEAVKYISLAFENGYRDITHLSIDADLDNIRENAEFKAVVAKWTKIINDEIEQVLSKENKATTISKDEIINQSTVIPMLNKKSGTYEVACKINDLPLNFIFDTGASDISISQTEVQFMLKNNYLNKSDIHGKHSFIDATGTVSIGTKITLRKVEIGDLTLKNIEASVVHSRNAPLLFGQSALGKYAKILIDNQNNTITISNK